MSCMRLAHWLWLDTGRVSSTLCFRQSRLPDRTFLCLRIATWGGERAILGNPLSSEGSVNPLGGSLTRSEEDLLLFRVFRSRRCLLNNQRTVALGHR